MTHKWIGIDQIQKDIDSGIREYVHDNVSLLKKRLVMASDNESRLIRKKIKNFNRLLRLR